MATMCELSTGSDSSRGREKYYPKHCNLKVCRPDALHCSSNDIHALPLRVLRLGYVCRWFAHCACLLQANMILIVPAEL